MAQLFALLEAEWGWSSAPQMGFSLSLPALQS